MKQKVFIRLASVLSLIFGLTSCGIDIPKETPSSFETLTVEESDIVLPLKSAAL